MSSNHFIDITVCENVLSVGTEYRNYRGGVGSVLNTYAENMRPFKFVSTHSAAGNFGNALYFVRAFFKIIFLFITDEKIEIVHLHSASRGSFFRKSFIVILSKIFGKKVVFHVHGGEFHIFYENSPELIQKYIRAILNSSDVVVCLSTSWLEFFKTIVPDRSVRIINNAVKSTAPATCENCGSNDLNLLFLGSINDKKGVYELVESLRHLDTAARKSVRLKIAGVGDAEKLQGLIEAFQVQDCAEYVGWADERLKSDLLHCCDAFVLPSHNEGLPISILEAMAAGKAIIATPVGGIPEIVRHEHNGLIVQPGDVWALTQAIEKLYLNPQALRDYGVNSKNAARFYTPEAVFSSLNDLYLNLDRK